jgi:hypothetical protein
VIADDRIVIDFGIDIGRSISMNIDEAAAFQVSLYATVRSFNKQLVAESRGHMVISDTTKGSTFDVEALQDPKIPWGKHKGSKLSTIEDDYLLWLVEKAEVDKLTPSWLNERVMNEWRKRAPKRSDNRSE